MRPLEWLSPAFDRMYACGPGFRTVRAAVEGSLLIALYSVRSECAFYEETRRIPAPRTPRRVCCARGVAKKPGWRP